MPKMLKYIISNKTDRFNSFMLILMNLCWFSFKLSIFIQQKPTCQAYNLQ